MAIGNAAHGLNQLSRSGRSTSWSAGRRWPWTREPQGSRRHPSGIVVIGNSTAAGAGIQPFNATPEDKACRRSLDSYAVDIAAVSHSTVGNLACTNASIVDGLFNSESINGQNVPSQLATLDGMSGVKAVLVSIGANEMHWAQSTELLPRVAAMRRQRFGPRCSRRHSTASPSTTTSFSSASHRCRAASRHRERVLRPARRKARLPEPAELTAAKQRFAGAADQVQPVLADGAASFGFEAVARASPAMSCACAAVRPGS